MSHTRLATALTALSLATALGASNVAHAQQPAPAPAPLPQQPFPQQQFPQQQAPQQPFPQQPQPIPPQQPQPFPQQQPPQAQYPQQQYPQQQPQYPQQQYPQQQQQQPYPPPQQYPQQPYPPQQYPQQQYPQQGYPPPQQGYPPQGYYPPQQGYPPPVQPSVPAVSPTTRGAGEMVFLYGASIGYGVGTGIWIDGLGKVSDPGLAFIAPLLLGAAAPVGVYFWDDYSPLHRGVPASIATGISLGTAEGIGISGVQWQHTGNGGPDTWSFQTQSTMTWVMASGGAVGGWAFGEWLRPDPRSLGFIASGAGWGALSGTLLGLGVSGDRAGDAASVIGLVGYNAGILAAGALSINYVPSWKTQKYMWYGFLGGTAAASVVYVFYLFSDSDPKHGLVANAIGGLAGLGLAGALTASMKDDDDAKTGAWNPPFQLGFAPLPHGGASMSAHGTF